MKVDEAGFLFDQQTVSGVVGQMNFVSTSTDGAKVDEAGMLYKEEEVNGVVGRMPVVAIEGGDSTPEVPTLQQVTESGNTTNKIIVAKALASANATVPEATTNTITMGAVDNQGANAIAIGYGKVVPCNSFLAVGNFEAGGNYGAAIGYKLTAIGSGAQVAFGIGTTAMGGTFYKIVSASGNDITLDTADIIAVSKKLRFVYKSSATSPSVSEEYTVEAVNGVVLTLNAAPKDPALCYGVAVVAGYYAQTAIGWGSVALNEAAIAAGRNALAAGKNSVAVGRNARALHEGSIVVGNDAESTEANQITLGGADRLRVTPTGNVEVGNPVPEANRKLNVKGSVKAENGDHTLTFSNTALMRLTTRSKYGGWSEFNIDSDESGAGGGLRWMHKGTVQAQMMTGSPGYPFTEGLTFDVTNGQHLTFVVRRNDGLVKFSNDPTKGTVAAATLDTTRKRFIIGNTAVDSGANVQITGAGNAQLQLANPFTPTGTDDTSGAVGTIAWDDSYVYIKTAIGWKRSALTDTTSTSTLEWIERSYTTTANLAAGTPIEFTLPTSIVSGLVTKLYVNGVLSANEGNGISSSENKVKYLPVESMTGAEIKIFYSSAANG